MANHERMMEALRNADAAGDTAAATRIAQMIREAQTQTPASVVPDNRAVNFGGPDDINVDAALQQTSVIDTSPEAIKQRTAESKSTQRMMLEGAGMAASMMAPGAGLAVRAGMGALGGGTGSLISEAVDPSENPAASALTAAALGAGGEAAGGLLGRGIRGGVKRLFRGKDVAGVGVAIDDASQIGGISPSVATATENRAMDMIETFTSRIPGGSGRIAKVAEKHNEALAKFLDKKSSALAQGRHIDAAAVGAKLVADVSDVGLAKFKNRADILFRRVDQHAPETASIDNIRGVLKKLAETDPLLPETSKVLASPGILKFSKAIEMDMAELAKILDGADAGKIAFSSMQKLRSRIGEKLSSVSLIDDINKGELKTAYRAISDDMRAALSGNPEGLKAFNNANKFYTAGLKRFDDFVGPAVKNNIPEKVYSALISGAKGGHTTLLAMKKSVSPKTWNLVAAGQIVELGKPAASLGTKEGSEFSFGTFLTNWRKINSKSKDALFSGPGMGGIRRDLDRVARHASRIRESSQAFANPPGTAKSLIGQGIIMGGMGGMGGALMAGQGSMALTFVAGLGIMAVGANSAARLMTSKRFVRWLATSTKVTPSGFASHLGRLTSIATASDPETRRAINDFMGRFIPSTQEGQ